MYIIGLIDPGWKMGLGLWGRIPECSTDGIGIANRMAALTAAAAAERGALVSASATKTDTCPCVRSLDTISSLSFFVTAT